MHFTAIVFKLLLLNMTYFRHEREKIYSSMKIMILKEIEIYLLGILLIALSGLRTRIVLIADRLMLPTSRQYSKALKKKRLNENVIKISFAIYCLNIINYA